MKLRSLALNQFKKFTAPTRLNGIGNGLNVVVGPNEMGKSTLLDALRAVLFEKYSAKAQAIKALQNDRNQAAPVVQLAFELDDGPYQITKRFIKNSYARLSCPDGRNLEGDAAEDTLRSLLDFHEPGKTGAKPESIGMWNVLWVQQGHSFGALAIPESACSSLHSALESEVGQVLGGRRGRALPAAIEKQLGQLITKKNNRPRGEYQELIARVEIVRKELDEIRDRRKNLTRTLIDLEHAQQNLKRLSAGEPDRADKKELKDARQRHSQLAKLEARIEAAVTELKLRKLTLKQASQAVEVRKQLKADIKAEETTLEEVGQQLTEGLGQEKKEQSKIDELRSAVRQSEKAVTEADETEIRSRRVLGVVERQSRLRGLESQYEKAKSAEKRQREAQQAAAAILVTDENINGIRKAAQGLETVQSRLNAAATLISFDMIPGGLTGMEVDGEPLAADRSSVHAVEPVTITIPGRGRITVEPAIKDRDKLLSQQRDAISKLIEALDDSAAKSVADAEDQYTERKKLLGDAELARQEAELHAPATTDYEAGAQALQDYIKGLRQVLKREMKDLLLQELPTRQVAEKVLRTAQENASTARSDFNSAYAALSGPEETMGRIKMEIGTLQGRYDIRKERLEMLKAQVVQAEEERSDNALQTDIETARNAFSEQQAVIRRLKAQRTDETLPQLEIRINRLKQVLKERRKKRDKLNVEVATLKSRVDAAEGAGLDEAVENKARELELEEEEKRRQDREVKVLRLLLETLHGAEQAAKEQYLSPVLKRVRPYLRHLFPGAEIRLDENLQITGLVRDVGYEENFDHLSMGTQEQIAVLVRLAFAEMLAEQGRPATVVLDDALVFSDDNRMNRIFDILNMAAQNVQVIIFTCREQLFENLGGRHLSLEPAGGEELASA